MEKMEQILVFSDNSDSKSIYLGFGNSNEVAIFIKNKSKVSLQACLGQQYSLIIVELDLPVMSEIEFVDQVHSLFKPIPVIVISSYFFDTKEIVFGEKLADFITKPFDLDKLDESYKRLPSLQAHAAPKEETIPEPPKVDRVVYENKKLSVLLEISRSLNAIKDFDELLHHIVVLAADTISAERATLFIVDKQKKELWSRSGIGIGKQDIRFPITTGIAGEVATSGESQIISDPYKHPKFNKNFDIKTGFKTRNILCVPMKNMSGEIVGVFQILNKKESEFTKEDQLFIAGMAANTGIAIENALLNEMLKKQLQEVKESYDELYIAQNQILKESKMVVISEIGGTIQDMIQKEEKISKPIKELAKSHGSDPAVRSALEEIHRGYSETILNVAAFLKTKKDEIGK